jgi:hypothetical protein
VVLGVLGLVYGGFSYTEEKHDVELGPIEVQVTDKERINVPVWLGVGAIAVGLLLLLADRRS